MSHNIQCIYFSFISVNLIVLIVLKVWLIYRPAVYFIKINITLWVSGNVWLKPT